MAQSLGNQHYAGLTCHVRLMTHAWRCFCCRAVVFGRVVEGLDVVDKLQNLATDRGGRPGQRVVSVILQLYHACAHLAIPLWAAERLAPDLLHAHSPAHPAQMQQPTVAYRCTQSSLLIYGLAGALPCLQDKRVAHCVLLCAWLWHRRLVLTAVLIKPSGSHILSVLWCCRQLTTVVCWHEQFRGR
jgi:hypothetical protein